MFIVSNRPAFRAALSAYLAPAYGPIEDLDSAAFSRVLLEGVVIVDCVALADAFTAIASIVQVGPQRRVVALVARPSDFVAAKARGTGVRALLSDFDSIESWTSLLERIEELPFQVGSSFAAAPSFGKLLTPRQCEIYEYIVRGSSDEEVALQLGIAITTAETHRRDIQRKLRCSGHRELMIHAIRNGVTDASDMPLQSKLRRSTRRHS